MDHKITQDKFDFKIKNFSLQNTAKKKPKGQQLPGSKYFQNINLIRDWFSQ